MAYGLVVAHAVAVLVLFGLTWTVGLVTYPGFAEVGRSAGASTWLDFHAAHARRMAWAVAPAWVVEGVTVAALLFTRPQHVPFSLVAISACAGAATVAVTVLRAVPLHQQLSAGYDPVLLRALRRAHLWRSLAWAVAAADGVAMMLLA